VAVPPDGQQKNPSHRAGANFLAKRCGGKGPDMSIENPEDGDEEGNYGCE
jgi:hypothetical protein